MKNKKTFIYAGIGLLVVAGGIVAYRLATKEERQNTLAEDARTLLQKIDLAA